jgi:hypothetical protein
LHSGLLRIADAATRAAQVPHEAHRLDRIPSGRNQENDNLSVTRLLADCYGTGTWASGPVIGVVKPEP